ncbi:MAG: Holliday junction branch migration protein RuvA [Marinilabiliales bacterium]|nr:MAG: Holliday junction branch migration protein RuvA [Marinilabiliales bacterium]
MYEYISGKVSEITPTYIVVENSGIGYFINISLFSYSKFNESENAKVFIYEAIREDAFTLYGFFDKKERDIFIQLISVSGIGANTARMMLSAMTPDEIQQAIISGNVALLKTIKGIGAKSAQRVIVDLRDKMAKITEDQEIFVDQSNTSKEEALSALVMLGFTKSQVEKTLSKMQKETTELSVEELIKEVLKRL